MKKLENALQKIDKYGQFVMKKLVNRRSLAELQGIGQGKTVLITGASSGIGAMMARRFAYLGYDLAICARREERLNALKQDIESKYPVKVSVKTLDVTDYKQIFTVTAKPKGKPLIKLSSMQGWAIAASLGMAALRPIAIPLKSILSQRLPSVRRR